MAETGHPEYLRLLDEMKELHCRKAADYGRGADPFANVRASADFGMPAWVGVMVRANDKMHRVKSFLQNGNLKNESVEDSLKDLAAYALIALVLYREQNPTPAVAAAPKGADGPHPKSDRPRVYIAGPITRGDLLHNLRQADAAMAGLMRAGIAPMNPMLSCYAGGADEDGVGVYGRANSKANAEFREFSHADWLAADFAWVDVADAVLRLPGESAGADQETERATARGIPVFQTTDQVIEWSRQPR